MNQDTERNLRAMDYMDSRLLVPPAEVMERICPHRWVSEAACSEHRCYRDRDHDGDCECVCAAITGEPPEGES